MSSLLNSNHLNKNFVNIDAAIMDRISKDDENFFFISNYSKETIPFKLTNSSQDSSCSQSIIKELISDDAIIKGKLDETSQIARKLEKYISQISNKKNEQVLALRNDLKTTEKKIEKFKRQEAKAKEIQMKYTDEKTKSQQLFEEKVELEGKIQDLETALKGKEAEMKTMEKNMTKEQNEFEKIKRVLLLQVTEVKTMEKNMAKEQAKHEKIKANLLLQINKNFDEIAKILSA